MLLFLHCDLIVLGYQGRLVWWSEHCLCCSPSCICYRCATTSYFSMTTFCILCHTTSSVSSITSSHRWYSPWQYEQFYHAKLILVLKQHIQLLNETPLNSVVVFIFFQLSATTSNHCNSKIWMKKNRTYAWRSGLEAHLVIDLFVDPKWRCE